MVGKWEEGSSFATPYEPIVPEFLKDAPQRIKDSFLKINSVGLDNNVKEAFEVTNTVNQYLSDLVVDKTYGTATSLSPRDLVGYEAAGSTLRRLYPSPFQINAFLGENYWVAAKCRKELWKEVDRDGFVLKSTSKSKNHLRNALDFLNKLDATSGRDVKFLRNKIRDNLATFGNSLMHRFKSNKKGYKQERLDVLLMEKVLPQFYPNRDEVELWNYFIGYSGIVLYPEQVDLVYTFSSRTNVMGAPPLGPIVVDIEAAMHSSIYNNTVMQKGGLLRGILALKDINNGGGVINDKTVIDLAEQLTKWYDRRFGGVRGAGQLAVGPFVDKWIDMNKIGEMDGACLTLNDKVGLRTCGVYGVPAGRCNLAPGSQYTNNAEVFDTISLSFDNEIYWTQGLSDDYLNIILAENDFGDVRIEPRGEFSSISKAAAEFLNYISMAYKNSGCLIMTVNEFRTRILRWEALDGPIGDMYIGEILSQDDPRRMALQAAGPPSSNKKRFEDDEGVISYNPNELLYYAR